MKPIPYLDRACGQIAEEKVYGGKVLSYLYSLSPIARLLRNYFAKNLWISICYGWWQKQPWTRRKIIPFIKEYHVDAREFLKPVSAFQSFNDFFTRELKPSSRPIVSHPDIAVIPADGRYLCFNHAENAAPFQVKGKQFNLTELLQDEVLAKRYAKGSLMMGRLCPSDYHRFHFPADCTPAQSQLLNGMLYSVNPIALKQNLKILWENKRMITHLFSSKFGQILYIEVGAMMVGSILQTYTPYVPVLKGQEKGYFSFGGSLLILLFEPASIKFDQDLIASSQKGMEVRCLMGQSLGRSYS